MTEQETALFLLSCTNYWANLMRGKDPDEMTKAWAAALKDVPLQAAKSGAANLAATLKFPPTVAELRTAAEEFLLTFCLPAPVMSACTLTRRSIKKSSATR